MTPTHMMGYFREEEPQARVPKYFIIDSKPA